MNHKEEFTQLENGDWRVDVYTKGRKLPLVGFIAKTKEEAAKMWLDYIRKSKHGKKEA